MFYIEALLQNWQRAIIGGAIVVSAVIVLLGSLKPLFKKIPNKLLRKAALAFSSVALAMPITAIYFAGAKINFDYFWVGYAMTAVATIITYWFYENTCLRDLIQKIGSIVWGKFKQYAVGRFLQTDDETSGLSEFQKVTGSAEEEVKDVLKTEISTAGTSSIRIPLSVSVVTAKPEKGLQKESEELKKL